MTLQNLVDLFTSSAELVVVFLFVRFQFEIFPPCINSLFANRNESDTELTPFSVPFNIFSTPFVSESAAIFSCTAMSIY